MISEIRFTHIHHNYTDLSPKLSTLLLMMYKISQFSPPRREESSGHHSETIPFQTSSRRLGLSSVRIAAEPQSRPRPDPPPIASLRRQKSEISVLSFYTSASSEYRTNPDSRAVAWDDMEQASMTQIPEDTWTIEHETSQQNMKPKESKMDNKAKPIQASPAARKHPTTTPPPSAVTALPATQLRAFWKRCLRYQT
jgi:hypothetical protein